MSRKRRGLIMLVILALCVGTAIVVFVSTKRHGNLLPHGDLFRVIFEWIKAGKYPVLFLLLFCCGLGLPLPEDVPLITSGILIQSGDFNLAMAAIVAWCGIIGGDCMLYMLGKKMGPNIVRVPIIGRHINVKRLKQVEGWFKRWGVWVVAVGRMFAGVRGAMVVVAGTSRFNFVKFIIADGLAAIVSGGLFVFLGYKFAQHRAELRRLVEQIKFGMGIGAIVLVVLIILFVRWRKRSRHAAEPDAAPNETSLAGEAKDKTRISTN